MNAILSRPVALAKRTLADTFTARLSFSALTVRDSNETETTRTGAVSDGVIPEPTNAADPAPDIENAPDRSTRAPNATDDEPEAVNVAVTTRAPVKLTAPAPENVSEPVAVPLAPNETDA